MSNIDIEMAAGIWPPAKGDILALPATTSTKWYALNLSAEHTAKQGTPLKNPSKTFWHDRFVTLKADGGKIYFLFGTSGSDTVVKTDNSETAFPTGACWFLVDGEERSYRLPKEGKFTHLAYQADSGTPTLRVTVSSRKALCFAETHQRIEGETVRPTPGTPTSSQPTG